MLPFGLMFVSGSRLDAEMLEMESEVLFGDVEGAMEGAKKAEEVERTVAPDEPLPSIEEEDQLLHPPDEPSDGYHRWDKQWHNISDQ